MNPLGIVLLIGGAMVVVAVVKNQLKTSHSSSLVSEAQQSGMRNFRKQKYIK